LGRRSYGRIVEFHNDTGKQVGLRIGNNDSKLLCRGVGVWTDVGIVEIGSPVFTAHIAFYDRSLGTKMRTQSISACVSVRGVAKTRGVEA
jgi:hypothetical protein